MRKTSASGGTGKKRGISPVSTSHDRFIVWDRTDRSSRLAFDFEIDGREDPAGSLLSPSTASIRSFARQDPIARTESQVASHARPPLTVTRLISHKFKSASRPTNTGRPSSRAPRNAPLRLPQSPLTHKHPTTSQLYNTSNPRSSVDVPPQPSKKQNSLVPPFPHSGLPLYDPINLRAHSFSVVSPFRCLSPFLDRLLLELYSLPPCTHELAPL